MSIFDDDKPKRKTIPKAVKITVWNKYIGADKAEGKCYVCGRTIHVTDFDLGHNKAVSKGGGNNIINLRPICRTCNNSMRTTSIETFKARHFDKPKANLKPALKALNITQLKLLAKKHNLKVKGRTEDDGWDTIKKAPTKQQYITRLSRIVTAKSLSLVPKETPKPIKKKKIIKSDNTWW